MKTINILSLLIAATLISCSEEEITPIQGFTSEEEIKITTKSSDLIKVEELLIGTWNTDVLIIGTSGVHNIQTQSKDIVCNFLGGANSTGDEASQLIVVSESDMLKVTKTYLCSNQSSVTYWKITIKNDSENFNGFENGHSFTINEVDDKDKLVRSYDIMALNPIVNDSRIQWLSVKLFYDMNEYFDPTNPKYYHIQFKK